MTAALPAVPGRVKRAGAAAHRIAGRVRDLTGELRRLREGGVRLDPGTNDLGADAEPSTFRNCAHR